MWGPERFTTLKSLRWAAWPSGGVFFPMSKCSEAFVLPNLWQACHALWSEWRHARRHHPFNSRRDRFCPRFVKRRECSRSDLPSTNRWDEPCSPDLTAFQLPGGGAADPFSHDVTSPPRHVSRHLFTLRVFVRSCVFLPSNAEALEANARSNTFSQR